MRNIAVSVIAMMWASLAQAQAPDISVGAGIDATHRNLRAEGEIRKRYETFVEAFNKHDAAAMAALWTRQGDHYEPDGTVAEGHEAVERLFKTEHSGAFKSATITLKIDSVWMITPNVALVNGTYQVDGVKDPNGNDVSLRKGLLTSVMLYEDGQWWVAASRTAIPIPLPWRKPPPQP